MTPSTTPLRRYLSFRFALMAFLPFLVMAGLIWQVLIPQVLDNEAVQQQRTARTIAGQVSAYLAGGEEQLKALARFVAATSFDSDSRIESLLDSHCGRGELFETIYVASLPERLITHAGLAQPDRGKREDILGLDLAGRPFIFEGKTFRRPVWSETFLSTVTGRLAVALAVSLDSRMIIGEITLDRMSEIISGLSVDGGFMTLVLDRNGRIVADSSRQRWGQQLEHAVLEKIRTERGASSVLVPFDQDGVRMAGTLVRVPPLNWEVLVGQPLATAYQPLITVLIMLGAGMALALVLALAAAWLQASSMSGHIGLFISHAKRIAQGEYHITLPFSRTAELTNLGQNLRFMAETINRREKELTASEMQLAITLDSIGDAVIATDTRGRITRMNPMAEDLTGWPREDALGMPLNAVFNIVNALTGQVVENPVKKVVSTGRMVEMADHTLLKARDGKEYQISDSGAPIRQENGDVVGVVLVFRDISEIYAKERQIRESEKLLKTITENIPEAVFQMEAHRDGTYGLRYISPKAEDIFEIPSREDDFIAEFLAHLPREDRRRFEASLSKAVTENRPWLYEGSFLPPSGGEVWFSGRADIQYTSGKMILNGVLADETRRHDMEKVLKITQFSFDNAAIGIFHVSLKGKIVAVNAKGAGQLGYTIGELTGKSLAVIDPELTAESWRQIRVKFGGRDLVQFERQHRKKSGEIMNVQITSSLLEYDGSKFSIAFVQDITPEKEHQVALARMHTYLADVFDSMPSVLIGVDRDHRISRWNKAVAELTGLSLDQAKGRPVEEVFPRITDHRDMIRRGIVSRQVARRQKIPWKTPEGEIRYEDMTVYPLTGSDMAGAVIRMDDITDKVRMEEVLIQNEKMLSVGGLAAGMAHEINNPLAGMMQNASVLANRLTSLEIPANVTAADQAGITMAAVRQFMESRGVPKMLKAVIDSGHRMAGIVENMLSFARKGDSTFSGHDPVQLMDSALALAATDYDLKKHYDFKSIEVVKAYEPGLPMVSCEGSKIQQVLLNILSNGAYAMFLNRSADAAPPKFILRLSFDAEPGVLRMEIEDNGRGMDEAIRKKIFEPFFTTKPAGEGTGLGLSVSYFIIRENHGGNIEVVSGPGRGATFIISLPVADGMGAKPPSQRP